MKDKHGREIRKGDRVRLSFIVDQLMNDGSPLELINGEAILAGPYQSSAYCTFVPGACEVTDHFDKEEV